MQASGLLSGDHRRLKPGVRGSRGTSVVVREPNGAHVALRTGGASYYYLTDDQGSVSSLVDTAGTERNHHSYDPYGGARTSTGTVANPLRYTGGYLDTATGLYKLGTRCRSRLRRGHCCWSRPRRRYGEKATGGDYGVAAKVGVSSRAALQRCLGAAASRAD